MDWQRAVGVMNVWVLFVDWGGVVAVVLMYCLNIVCRLFVDRRSFFRLFECHLHLGCDLFCVLLVVLYYFVVYVLFVDCSHSLHFLNEINGKGV